MSSYSTTKSCALKPSLKCERERERERERRERERERERREREREREREEGGRREVQILQKPISLCSVHG